MRKLVQKDYLVLLAGVLVVFHSLISLLKYFAEISAIETADYILGGITGLYAVLYFLLFRPRLRFSLRTGLLYAMLFWYILSCTVMSVRYGSAWFRENNALRIYDTAVLFLAVYMLGCCSGREGIHPALRIAIRLCLLTWTAFMLYVLVRLPQTAEIPLPNRGTICFSQSRLCLNCNPNSTGIIAMTAFLLSCIMVDASKSLMMKGIYVFSGCVHYLVLVFSNSRTMLAATAIGFAGMIGTAALTGCCGKHRRLIAAGAAAVSAMVFFLARDQVFAFYKAVSGEAFRLEGKKFVSSSILTLTGRTGGFRFALLAMTDDLQCFLTGVTPPVVKLAMYKASGGVWDMYTHNQILEIGVALGVPAAGGFTAWLFLLGKDCLKLCRTVKNRREIMFVSLILLAFVLANMLEATLLFYRYIISYVFFFLAGWIHGVRLAGGGEGISGRPAETVSVLKKGRTEP